jgi:hypothetical protein
VQVPVSPDDAGLLSPGTSAMGLMYVTDESASSQTGAPSVVPLIGVAVTLALSLR